MVTAKSATGTARVETGEATRVVVCADVASTTAADDPLSAEVNA